MTRSGPLPLAPPPYPAEALHSWLLRVAAPYGMRPRQLLHALAIHPFCGPARTFPDLSVQSVVEGHDLRYLARLARCDPSRLGLDAPRPRQWLLVRDDWIMACPQCFRADLRANALAYERASWRVATGSFCLRHRAPLVQAPYIPQNIDDFDLTRAMLSDFENIVAAQLIEFEREIAQAHRGIAPHIFDGSLDAKQFLEILQDLSTFAVQLWDMGNYRMTSSLDQHAQLLVRECPHLFSYHRPRLGTFSHPAKCSLTFTQIADPAMRRAALWLVMEAIRYPPSPGPRHALRLGYSAQEAFLGNRPHAGWAWLQTRARAWPSVYRSRYWAGFVAADDSVKGTDDKVKGSQCH